MYSLVNQTIAETKHVNSPQRTVNLAAEMIQLLASGVASFHFHTSTHMRKCSYKVRFLIK